MSDEWMTARDVSAFLGQQRTEKIKVRVNGLHVPILDVYYDKTADAYVLELLDSFGYQSALLPNERQHRYGGGPQR